MTNDNTTPGSEHQPPAPDPSPWYGPPAGAEQTPPPYDRGDVPSHWPHPAGVSWGQSASPTSEMPEYGASAYGAPGYHVAGAASPPAEDASSPSWDSSLPSGDAPTDGPRHGGGAVRRRFGALALGIALVAGGGAGAATSALVAGGSSNVAAVSSPIATSPVALSTNTSSAQALIAKVEPSLVDIHTTGTSVSPSPIFGNGRNPFGGSGGASSAAAGTGMLINSSGLVLTNAHVLEGSSTITVTLNGKTATLPATLVGEDATKDIALIQIKGVSGLPSVSLGDSSKAQAGDPVLAIGNALDLQNGGFTASNGIISGLNRSIQTNNSESLTGLIQTSAAISSGDSGGPLVDGAGQVIGMNTAAAGSSSNNTASNIGFAIPSNQISGLISQLQKGSIGQTTTGSGSGSGGAGSGSSGGSGGYGGGYGSYGGYGSGSGGSSSGGLFG